MDQAPRALAESPPDSTGALWRQSGHVQYRLSPQSVGPVFYRGREVIRRIFVTVRDAQWREITPLLARLEEPGPGRARFRASYESENVDFEWLGALDFEQDGAEVSFAIEGLVPRDGEVCRLGLIVLLPPAIVSGAAGEILTGGSRQKVAIPDVLGPQPIRDGWPAALTEPFSAIKLTGGGVHARFAFQGEQFELEDQRNWGDASYKIYCTPLAAGFPREVKAGQRVVHRVVAQFDVVDAPVCSPTALLEPRPFPSIGVEASARDLEVSSEPIPWAHASRRCGDLGSLSACIPVELRLLSEDLADRAGLATKLRASPCRLVRLLLEGEGDGPPSANAVAELRGIASSAGLDVPIFAATRGYFVELNRGLPIATGADGVAWPMAPTVHSSDLDTILENATPFLPQMRHLQTAGINRAAVAPLGWTYPARDLVVADLAIVEVWLAATLIDAATWGMESVTLSAELASAVASSVGPSSTLALLASVSGADVLPLATGVEGVVAMLKPAGENSEILVVNVGRAERSLPLPVGRFTLAVPARSIVRHVLRNASQDRAG